MIKIKLQASTNKGYLYQFCATLKALEKILREGIEPSKYGEYTWEKSPKIQKDSNGMQTLVCFTRNPSSIIQLLEGGWRYAVIVDSDVLSEHYLLRPYAYHFRPGMRTVEVWEDRVSDKWWGKKSGGGKSRKVELTPEEVGELYDWADDLYQHQSAFLDVDDIDDDSPTHFVVSINLGDEESYDQLSTLKKKEEYEDDWDYQRANRADRKLHRIGPGKVIHPMAKILAAAMSESEERLYPKNKPLTPGKNIDIKKALVGVLIPDTGWFSGEREILLRKYPNLDIYLYDDRRYRNKKAHKVFLPTANKNVEEGLKEYPEDKQRYRLPR